MEEPTATRPEFTADVLRIDAGAETERINQAIRDQVLGRLRKRGVVVAMSGGVDSSVVAALCAQALGAARVLGLFMPERDSDPASLDLAQALARKLGIASVTEDVGPALEALGCYRRRDDAIRQVVPEYGPGCKSKIVLKTSFATAGYNLFWLVVRTPAGEELWRRLPLEAYLGIVAATNLKQRTRKQLEYYHADRLNFAVAGTPNRLEYDQGFFVKNGDGAADLKPIAHLYKSQVYQLAEYLQLPESIRSRAPTTDTYSLPQSQEEFYFGLPHEHVDLCLYALNHGVPPGDVARVIGLAADQVAQIHRDAERKRRATRYLHAPPLLVEAVPEVDA